LVGFHDIETMNQRVPLCFVECFRIDQTTVRTGAHELKPQVVAVPAFERTYIYHDVLNVVIALEGPVGLVADDVLQPGADIISLVRIFGVSRVPGYIPGIRVDVVGWEIRALSPGNELEIGNVYRS